MSYPNKTLSVESQSVWLKADPSATEFTGYVYCMYSMLRLSCPSGRIRGYTHGGSVDCLFYFSSYSRTVIRLKGLADDDKIEINCSNLEIASVSVDGEDASFTLTDCVKKCVEEDCDFGKPGHFQREASDCYKSVLAAAYSPNLLVEVPSSVKHRMAAPPQNLGDEHTVEIVYSLAFDIALGVEAVDGYIITQDAPGSASGWVPCLDAPNMLVGTFELHLLVPEPLVAVASGELKSVEKSSRMSDWTMYRYSMPLECAPSDVAFVVGELSLECTSAVGSSEGSATLVLNQFVPVNSSRRSEDYVCAYNRTALEALCDAVGGVVPTPSVNIVILPERVMSSALSSGIGFQAISLHDVPPMDFIEKSQALRCDIAVALARQWFGYYVRPASSNDTWMVTGLQHWLGDQLIQSYIGKTDCIYRKWLRHNAVAEMDNGEAPPLAFHGWRADGCPWGPFCGTERCDPTQYFSRKAAVVVSMVENRAGDQLFKKQVENLVTTSESPSNPKGSCSVKLDAKEFLIELSKAGDFRAEVNPFMERWVFGAGAPMISLGVQYQKRGCMLDVGLKQVGSETAFSASLSAEQEAAKEKVGIAGIIKVSVMEGSGARVDHPLHLGAKGYLAQTVKVNPEVKKIAGKRGRKKKSEEALVAAKQAALQNAQHPVQYVRLDSGSEFLCRKYVHQAIRMTINQLKNSRDVVAQAEAVRELSSVPLSPLDMRPLESLSEALEDHSVHWAVRCEVAHGLSQLIGEDGGCAGVQVLISYYKKRFWDLNEDTPVRLQFADIDELLVTEAVLDALSSCKSSNGYSDFDVISFFLECTDAFWPEDMHIDCRPILAAFMRALGNLRCDKNEEQLVDFIHEKGLEKLEWYLKRDLVVDVMDHCVAEACLFSMVSLTRSGSCPKPIVSKIARILCSYCNDKSVPYSVTCAGLQASVQFKAAWQGSEAAISWCMDLLPNLRVFGTRFVRTIWKQLILCLQTERISTSVLARLASFVCSAGADAHLRHLAFMAAAIITKSGIYVSETYADAKPSLIKLNAAPVVAHHPSSGAAAAPDKVEEDRPDQPGISSHHLDELLANKRPAADLAEPRAPSLKLKLKKQ